MVQAHGAVAREVQNVRRDAVEEPTVVADDERGAIKRRSASSSERSVARSRSFVGSSNTSTLPFAVRSRARSTRFRSPPDSCRTTVLRMRASKPKRSRNDSTRTGRPSTNTVSARPATASVTVASRSSSVRIWSMPMNTTVSPTTRVPRSGASSPTRMRIRVDFPAPFGPTMPSRMPGASSRSSGFSTVRSPKAFVMPSTMTTFEPSRGPGGIVNSRSAESFVGAPSTIAW
jgi:hypothetical protein